MSSAQTAHRERARITRCWLGPFGAVSPGCDRPGSPRSPQHRKDRDHHRAARPTDASKRRIPQPSHQPAPSAAAEKVLQRPSGAKPAAGPTNPVSGSTSPSHRPQAPDRTRPAAAPRTPGAAPPATTSTPCRSSSPDPEDPAHRRAGPTGRSTSCPSPRHRHRSSSTAVVGADRAEVDPGHGPQRLGRMPARSNASHATSRTRRCCGSISTASRGAMPKNDASNCSTSSRNPPSRA